MSEKTVKFMGQTLIVRFNRYITFNNPVIQLVSRDGEPWCVASVNPECKLAEGEVAIKNWSENEGIDDALVMAGIISTVPHRFIRSGWVQIPIHKLLVNA